MWDILAEQLLFPIRTQKILKKAMFLLSTNMWLANVRIFSEQPPLRIDYLETCEPLAANKRFMRQVDKRLSINQLLIFWFLEAFSSFSNSCHSYKDGVFIQLEGQCHFCKYGTFIELKGRLHLYRNVHSPPTDASLSSPKTPVSPSLSRFSIVLILYFL